MKERKWTTVEKMLKCLSASEFYPCDRYLSGNAQVNAIRVSKNRVHTHTMTTNVVQTHASRFQMWVDLVSSPDEAHWCEVRDRDEQKKNVCNKKKIFFLMEIGSKIIYYILFSKYNFSFCVREYNGGCKSIILFHLLESLFTSRI